MQPQPHQPHSSTYETNLCSRKSSRHSMQPNGNPCRRSPQGVRPQQRTPRACPSCHEKNMQPMRYHSYQADQSAAPQHLCNQDSNLNHFAKGRCFVIEWPHTTAPRNDTALTISLHQRVSDAPPTSTPPARDVQPRNPPSTPAHTLLQSHTTQQAPSHPGPAHRQAVTLSQPSLHLAFLEPAYCVSLPSTHTRKLPSGAGRLSCPPRNHLC